MKESRRKIQKSALIRGFTDQSSQPDSTSNTRCIEYLIYQHNFRDCKKTLGKLGIRPVCDETVDAYFIVCRWMSWVKKFLTRRFQEAREDLLHIAVEEAMAAGNFDLIRLLLPAEILNRKHVMCMLSAATSALTDSNFFLLVGIVYAESSKPKTHCLTEALSHKRWPIVCKLLNLWQPSKPVRQAVLEAAIPQEQWEVIQVCLENSVDKTLLNRALVRAIQSRRWDIVETCVKQGGNIADACAENGFNLNDMEHGCGNTVLHHAIAEECRVKVVEQLLQAGADPDATDRHGETTLHAAAWLKGWDRLRLLLKYSQTAGTVASARLSRRHGRTLLHHLCNEGQADIVHTLLVMNADPLVTDDSGETLMTAASKAAEGGENVYRALIQSGISTHQGLASQLLLASVKRRHASVDEDFSSPMWSAVKLGLFRIAKMLHAAGTCTNREIHELSASPSIRAHLENSKRLHVLEFLDDISTHPRSLRALCALTVSHLIGCGAARDHRAARTGLPPPVLRQVLHTHVTDPDFLKDCPPDPQGIPRDRLHFFDQDYVLRVRKWNQADFQSDMSWFARFVVLGNTGTRRRIQSVTHCTCGSL